MSILKALFFILSFFYIACDRDFYKPLNGGVSILKEHFIWLVKKNDIAGVRKLITRERCSAEEIKNRNAGDSAKEGICFDANVKDGSKKTALFYVQSVEMAKLLIDEGADVHIKDEDGETPLHFAHTPAIAKFFLDHGLDLEARSDNGGTPLYNAVLEEKIKTARFLFQQGANPYAKTNSGWTPLSELQAKAGWFDFSLNSLIREFKSYTPPKTRPPETPKGEGAPTVSPTEDEPKAPPTEENNGESSPNPEIKSRHRGLFSG